MPEVSYEKVPCESKAGAPSTCKLIIRDLDDAQLRIVKAEGLGKHGKHRITQAEPRLYEFEVVANTERQIDDFIKALLQSQEAQNAGLFIHSENTLGIATRPLFKVSASNDNVTGPRLLVQIEGVGIHKMSHIKEILSEFEFHQYTQSPNINRNDGTSILYIDLQKGDDVKELFNKLSEKITFIAPTQTLLHINQQVEAYQAMKGPKVS